MKKTTLILSSALLLVLFAGGCTSVGVSDQMTSNCFGCSYERLPDYKTLVNGSIDVSHGDYIYIPSFIIKKSKIKPKFKLKKFDNKIDNDQTKNYNLLDADSISILSKIEIYDGIKNTSVSSFEKEYLISQINYMVSHLNVTLIYLFFMRM